MNSAAEDSWAQLVCITDIDTEPVPISKDKFLIGRNGTCDISHAGNKLVSGNHCYVERDHKGKVWLYDTSTNGTLLNLKIKLSKGECRELKHGDEFHLVHKKDNTDEDIGYMFQDLKALEAETSSDLEATEEYDFDQTIPDENATVADEDVVVTSTQCLPQKRKAPDEEISCPSKKSKEEEKECASTSKAGDSSSTSTPKPKDTSQDEPKPSSSGKEATEASGKAKEPEEDAIAETLVCCICQELLHDCISLQPCMHSFCSGCYSEWMELSQECPSCRLKVERINKNHIVNNLVAAYLKMHPEKKRPDIDIQTLDAKNKITRDMLYPVNQDVGSLQGSQTVYSDSDDNRSGSNEEDDDDDDGDDDDDEGASDDGADGYGNYPVYYNPNNALGRAAVPICRQCPQYDPARDVNAIMAAAQPGPPADPDEKRMPVAPAFLCKIRNANHVLCLCCLQPMPDRRKEFNFRPDCSVPPQQCALCYRSFCHAYWGCRRPTCNGCIGKLKDMNFGKGCLPALLKNPYESDIFKNYLESKGLSVRDVLGICLAKMVNMEYTCEDEGRIRSQNGINTPVCYTCGIKNFQDLAYCYRRDIPNADLPPDVTARPDCHWGKNCRTQRNKPDHAKRFNHICEQSRIA